jgi:hypothetical protein
MKLLPISIILFCLAISSSITSKEKAKKKKPIAKEWSDYQGEFRWQDAKDKIKGECYVFSKC